MMNAWYWEFQAVGMSGCEKPPCLRSARFYMVPIHRESVVADGPQCSFELVDVAAAVPLVLRQQLGQMSMEIHVLAHSTKIGSIFDLSSPQFDLVFRSNTTEICPVIRDLFESPPKSATIAKTLVAGGLAIVSFSPCCRTVAMGCN